MRHRPPTLITAATTVAIATIAASLTLSPPLAATGPITTIPGTSTTTTPPSTSPSGTTPDITPTGLTLVPDTVAAGSTTHLHLPGMQPGAHLSIYLAIPSSHEPHEPTFVAETTVPASRIIDLGILIPTTTTPGPYKLLVHIDGTPAGKPFFVAITDIDITAAPAPVATPTQTTPTFTG